MSLFPLPPLSLYVHIPWCVRKCPYCDFNSHAVPDSLPEADYVARLVADLEQDAAHAQGRKLQSIFFGGGTPSLFSPTAIGTVLDAAERLIGLEPAAEITLEANPGTVEQSRFKGFHVAGVNRLSIGIQSFNNVHLQALGRIHNGDEAHRAALAARSAGFDNFNLDLMHGLPQQSPQQALADLEQAIALAPAHISWYQLTIEQNTAFYRHPPTLPDNDILADIEELGLERLAGAGFQRYEISAYSRPGRESRHNRNYWEFADYLGIGAGAHGKITQADDLSVWRSQKTRAPGHYMADQIPRGSWRQLGTDDLTLEFMMNALRLTEGVPSAYYEQRTGLALAALEPELLYLKRQQMLQNDDQRLAPTPLGHRFLNDVLDHFMTEPD